MTGTLDCSKDFSVSGLPLVVQWLRLHALNAGGMDLIPCWGTKTLYAEHSAKKKKKKKKKKTNKWDGMWKRRDRKKKKAFSVSLLPKGKNYKVGRKLRDHLIQHSKSCDHVLNHTNIPQSSARITPAMGISLSLLIPFILSLTCLLKSIQQIFIRQAWS